MSAGIWNLYPDNIGWMTSPISVYQIPCPTKMVMNVNTSITQRASVAPKAPTTVTCSFVKYFLYSIVKWGVYIRSEKIQLTMIGSAIIMSIIAFGPVKNP